MGIFQGLSSLLHLIILLNASSHIFFPFLRLYAQINIYRRPYPILMNNDVSVYMIDYTYHISPISFLSLLHLINLLSTLLTNKKRSPEDPQGICIRFLTEVTLVTHCSVRLPSHVYGNIYFTITEIPIIKVME